VSGERVHQRGRAKQELDLATAHAGAQLVDHFLGDDGALMDVGLVDEGQAVERTTSAQAGDHDQTKDALPYHCGTSPQAWAIILTIHELLNDPFLRKGRARPVSVGVTAVRRALRAAGDGMESGSSGLSSRGGCNRKQCFAEALPPAWDTA